VLVAAAVALGSRFSAMKLNATETE
jgi:hypothetical protein